MPKREYCLQEAAAAQAMADDPNNAGVRARLLKAANQWKKLADSFEETERNYPEPAAGVPAPTAGQETPQL